VAGCYLLGIYDKSEPMSAKEHSNKLCRFEIRVRKTIEKHSMLNPRDHVLVAVSGGADSVALLLCLHILARTLPLSLTIAHLNHRIRGQEGDADEDFVRSLSAGLHLPFCSEAIEVKKQAIAGKHNLEELARLKRYEFLRRTARRIGAQKIAVGHNLNDQAETVHPRERHRRAIRDSSGRRWTCDPAVVGLFAQRNRRIPDTERRKLPG
jgi:tRNA(Ile)-lysidine synthase